MTRRIVPIVTLLIGTSGLAVGCNAPVTGDAVSKDNERVAHVEAKTPTSPLPPLPEGYAEEEYDLAGGQALLLRINEFGPGFMAAIVEGGGVVASTDDPDAFFGLKKGAVAEMSCEDNLVEVTLELAGSHRMIVAKWVCSRGADARLVTDIVRIIAAPKAKVTSFEELGSLWSGEGAWMENVHDMCISGHRAVYVEKDGKLALVFESFADFQPDPEFGAVEEEDCVKPETKAPIMFDDR